MNYFQFNGTTLLKWTDRYGTSHPLDSLGNGQCNLKAPTLFTDEGKITEKSLLPIKSWSYGPRQFEYEKIAITIGGLRCEQNNSIEQESQENLSTLKTLINTRAADIKNEIVNLHEQMEIGTNGKIDDLKANIKLFVVEKVNASETFIETKIHDLTTTIEGDTDRKIGNLKTTLKSQCETEINNSEIFLGVSIQNIDKSLKIYTSTKLDELKNSLESHVRTKIEAFDTSVQETITNHEGRIDTLEKTDIKQNEEIEKRDDHENRIDDLEVGVTIFHKNYIFPNPKIFPTTLPKQKMQYFSLLLVMSQSRAGSSHSLS